MSLQETFRLRKSILCQGILYAVFFFLATAAYSFLFFLDNPAQQGFKDGHAAAILGGAGVALFGFMLLLSLGMIRAYCVEQFRVTGTTLHVRSVLQNQQFDRSEIQCVRWKTCPSGAIRFRVFGRTTRLDLHGFAREDRLRIIRIVRALVPAASQQGWEMFCHKIALPLRDGTPATLRVDDSIRTVLVTRKRYDRLFAVLVPICAVVSAGLWCLFGGRQIFLLPLGAVGFWLLLRFNIPKTGVRSAEVTSFPCGRAQLAGWTTIVLANFLFIGMALAGVRKNVDCEATCIFLLVGMIPFFFYLIQADRQQRAADRRGAETADGQWERGELEMEAAKSG